jgi:hypothetical protein
MQAAADRPMWLSGLMKATSAPAGTRLMDTQPRTSWLLVLPRTPPGVKFDGDVTAFEAACLEEIHRSLERYDQRGWGRFGRSSASSLKERTPTPWW